MNAVNIILSECSRRDVSNLWAQSFGKDLSPALSAETIRARLLSVYELDLAGLLNRLSRHTLERLAKRFERYCDEDDVADLRLRLWRWGATKERECCDEAGALPIVEPSLLRSKLVFFSRGNGFSSRSFGVEDSFRSAGQGEPDSLDELLCRANELIGAPLPERGRDKGGQGATIASMLGLVESGVAEPDWRGEVEVKTVPVARDAKDNWYIVEDPAIAMEGVNPLVKLNKVLWIARMADSEVSSVLDWYYQEWDLDVARFVKRDLHQRPKGGKGATTKGWYLHKRFFVDSGFLAVLNG